MPHRSLEAGRISTAKHYAANKEYYKERNRKAIERYRAVIAEAKDRPCVDCGIQYPHYVMQFDHLRDKLFNISRVSNIPSMKRLLEEIAKCEVVCANCHAERTYRRRLDNASEGV